MTGVKKVLLACFYGLGIATIAGALIAFCRDEAAHRAAALEAARTLRAELIAIVPREVRPHAPLTGPSVAGDAIPHLQLAASASRAVIEIIDQIGGSELPPDTEAILAKSRTVLDEIAAAARSATFDFGAVWRSLSDPRTGPLLTDFEPWHAVHLDLRQQLQRRAFDEAIATTVSLLTCTRDLLATGIGFHELGAASLLSIVAESWRDDDLRALTELQLRALATLLAAFETSSPVLGYRAFGDVLFQLEHVLDPAHAADFDADLVRSAVETARERRAMESVRWTLQRAALQRRAATSDDNDLALETTLRRGRTDLRLLAACIAHHLGDPIAFADPLGDGDLAIEAVDDTTIVVRSASRDDKGQRIERTATRR